MNKKKRKLTGKYFIVFLIYVFYSVAIHQEFHPFTMVPMFSSFPDYVHTFFITDDKNNLIPIQENFNYSSGYFSHSYFAIGTQNDINTENLSESDGKLKLMGDKMLSVLNIDTSKLHNIDNILLYQRVFYWEDGQIRSKDLFMSNKTLNN